MKNTATMIDPTRTSAHHASHAPHAAHHRAMAALIVSPRSRRTGFFAAALLAGVLLGAGVGGLGGSASAQTATSMTSDFAYTRSGMKINGQIIDGAYDFTFRLFDAPTGGAIVGEAVTVNNVQVVAGKLPSLSLNFGDGVFNGDARWIDVRGRSGGGAFKIVGPRTEVLAVPYALALPFMRSVPDSGPSPNIVGGFYDNSIADNVFGSVIAGGGGNAGAQPNSITESLCTISGGTNNLASGAAASIGGGYTNTASGGSTVVAGGYTNTASGNAATVGGGSTNIASGTASIVPGGKSNTASGNYSFAAGFRGKASHAGSFVWADTTNADFNSFTTNSFNVRAAGGFFFYTNAAQTSGAVMAPGDGSWSALSDRNMKENFETIDGREVLDRLAALRIATWNYKSQDASIRHIGPMAQDFKAAFEVGGDERRITTVDADGVLFAAVQGLNMRMRDQAAEMQRHAEAVDALNVKLIEELRMRDARLAEQAAQIAELRERVAQMERMMNTIEKMNAMSESQRK